MQNKRIIREQNCIEKMITIYCQDIHGIRGGFCEECKSLLEYATQRLARCMFHCDKPVCAKCPVHCYNPVMRKKVILVMRYAGARMLYKYPLLAIRHIIDSLKKVKPINK